MFQISWPRILWGVQSPQGKAEAPVERSRSSSQSPPRPSVICIQETAERKGREQERGQLNADRWRQWGLSSYLQQVRKIDHWLRRVSEVCRHICVSRLSTPQGEARWGPQPELPLSPQSSQAWWKWRAVSQLPRLLPSASTPGRQLENINPREEERRGAICK